MPSNMSKSSSSQFISAIKKVRRSKPEPTPPQSQAYILDLTLVDSLATYPAPQSPVDSIGASLNEHQRSQSQESDSDMLDMENMAWGSPPPTFNQGWVSSIFARKDPRNPRRNERKAT